MGLAISGSCFSGVFVGSVVGVSVGVGMGTWVAPVSVPGVGRIHGLVARELWLGLGLALVVAVGSGFGVPGLIGGSTGVVACRLMVSESRSSAGPALWNMSVSE